MPEEWTQYRVAVRAVANTVRDAITAAESVTQLQAAVTDIQWPHDPNYVEPTTEQV